MGDTISQTRFENVSKLSNDLLPARGSCMEKTKTSQQMEIDILKRRVKKLEKRNRSRTHKLKRLYKVGLSARVESFNDAESLGEDASRQGRIHDIDANENITLVNVYNDAEMFDVNDLGGKEVFIEKFDAAQDNTAGNNCKYLQKKSLLAQALESIKKQNLRSKGIVIQEPGESTTTTPTIISSQQSHDKGKGVMVEEPVKPKKKDQIRLDEEAAKSLQAEINEEERLARERAKKEQEANIALIETWDDIQAKIDADHQLTKRLQA
ncbi:hypothetical protein Tco_0523577 [Tanacetum coccineum]